MTTRMSDHRMKMWVYFIALAVYLACGYWLQVQHGFILGDALSRVSAYDALGSFALAPVGTAVAGGLYAYLVRYVNPESALGIPITPYAIG